MGKIDNIDNINNINNIDKTIKKVSVVISAYSMDRIDDIVDLLNSLKNQTCNDFEVVFVVDGTKELMEKMKPYIEKVGLKNIKIVCAGENKGLSNARNLGIKNSSGDIIAFIDDDAIADEKWIEETIKAFERHPDAWGVTGYGEGLWLGVKPEELPEILWWIVGDASYMFDKNDEIEVRNPHGYSMAFKKWVFDKVGLFSLEFGKKGNLWLIGEDSEIGIRIYKNGGKIIYIPSIKIKHKIYPYRVELKNIIKRAFYEGYSKAYIEKIHGKILSKEDKYLKKIFFEFYPKAFLKLFKSPLRALKQMIVVALVVLFVGVGYLYGKVFGKL